MTTIRPAMTLWEVAQCLAIERMTRATEARAHWHPNICWRDDGGLPSGDRFTLWLTYHAS